MQWLQRLLESSASCGVGRKQCAAGRGRVPASPLVMRTPQVSLAARSDPASVLIREKPVKKPAAPQIGRAHV